MDVRIGVTQAPREISIEMADDADREAVRGAGRGGAVRGGRRALARPTRRAAHVAVPAAKIAYVEIGSADSERRIGFGG